MYKLNVNEKIIEHCTEQLTTHNFGHRYTANGNYEQQLTGIIGQSVVMEIFGLGFIDGSSGFDHGVDIYFEGLKIDVKTMGRTTDVKPNYTNNFLRLQDHFDIDIYIFCSFHKFERTLTICGWIDKEKFIRYRRFYPIGSIRTRYDGTTFKTFTDLYEIDNSFLNDVDNSIDLINQLKQHK